MTKSKPEAMTITDDDDAAAWHQRVVQRSLRAATKRSIDRGSSLIRAAAALLERSNGEGFTVQDVADEAGQSLRTLYQYFESKDDLMLAVHEESMRTYAKLIRDAIVDLSDPLERLCGALIAAVRMREFTGAGVDRGLARLRLKLTEVQPELVARSKEPVTTLMHQLVAAAAESGQIRTSDPEAATYMVLSLKTALITSNTLGNEWGLRLPSVSMLVTFCLDGLGAELDGTSLEVIDGKLHLPRRVRLDSSSMPERRPRTRKRSSSTT